MKLILSTYLECKLLYIMFTWITGLINKVLPSVISKFLAENKKVD